MKKDERELIKRLLKKAFGKRHDHYYKLKYAGRMYYFHTWNYDAWNTITNIQYNNYKLRQSKIKGNK